MFTLRTDDSTSTKKTKRSDSSTATNTNTSVVAHSIDLNVYENPKEIVILAQLPGVMPESIDVSLEADILMIKANIAEPNLEGFEALAQECRFGQWERSVRLTTGLIQYGNIRASAINGILFVRLAKMDLTQFKIEVK